MQPDLKARPARGTPKAEGTRTRILSTALRLFRERGFGPTTMREIAAEAGVATGGAYYYFDSKEALVLAFYREASAAMHDRIEGALQGKTDLGQRLRAVIDVKFDYFAPNRAFLGALMQHAADPQNPLSPFSETTRVIRETDLAHFSAALEGSAVRTTADLRPYLPRLLWLYQMGLILFWIYDRSPEQSRTQRLVDKSLGIVALLLKLAGSRFLKPLRKTSIELFEAIFDEPAEEGAP
jgi:AcrR family transcriptional regulator